MCLNKNVSPKHGCMQEVFTWEGLHLQIAPPSVGTLFTNKTFCQKAFHIAGNGTFHASQVASQEPLFVNLGNLDRSM